MQPKKKKNVPKRAHIKVGELLIPVKILQEKTAYGVKRYLVSPIGGSGEEWKREDSIILA